METDRVRPGESAFDIQKTTSLWPAPGRHFPGFVPGWLKTSVNSVREGIRYIGTVVSVDQKYVRINLDCHVRASTQVIGLNGARLHYGDRVSVGVTGKNDRMRTVYGTCLPIATRTF